MNGYEDLRQIKTRIQAVTNILLHEFIRKTLAFYENKSRDSKNCFLQEKIQSVSVYLIKIMYKCMRSIHQGLGVDPL
ncbi:hypothetical protein AP3564_00360 [Aeribacillus pallidus]|uniref:Uncharacterized protein n=1 Tax=Aeribacillus pallidus TaxID=33936 RepID=A0A223E125_9BACI|nr:hypothetical protein AP3564_00360 [Aeribacillus pallidus]